MAKAKSKPVVTVEASPSDERVAIIRTSDRIAFKSCRRKWNWSSHLREFRRTKIVGDPLWLGSAMHFALEDFHGFKKYKTPSLAIQAFAAAYQKYSPKRVPDDWLELLRLGMEMMDYYPLWLTARDPLKTYVLKKVPQVEISVKIPIDWKFIEQACGTDTARFQRIRAKYDRVEYSMTFDRVIEDDEGMLWIQEYKSAKIIQTAHYLVDPQIGAYVWGAEQLYEAHGKKIAGVIYQQHKKSLPKPARQLNNGLISTAQNQSTSHMAYRKALIDKYGTMDKAPGENVRFLNDLAKMENADADSFIRRDRVYRNKAAGNSLAQHLLHEICDMLDPELPLYPNPTRMCTQMCSYVGPCVSMEDGSDWEDDLESETEQKDESYDAWRICLPDPKKFKGINLAQPTLRPAPSIPDSHQPEETD